MGTRLGNGHGNQCRATPIKTGHRGDHRLWRGVGGCNGVNLPTYNGGGNTYNGSHGSHYSGGCDHYHRSDCGGGGDGRENDDRGSGHERRHHPGATETPDPDNR